MRNVPQHCVIDHRDEDDIDMKLEKEVDAIPQAVESEESSTDSSGLVTTTTTVELASSGSRRRGLKKRVSWNSIQTREYAPVVGDHPLCHDGLPVSLGWSFCDNNPNDLVKAPKVSERKSSYVFPRRLSYEDRRQRLVSVSGLTADEVKNDEIDLVVRTLKESWENVADEEPMQTVVDPLADISMWGDADVPCMDLDVDLGDISDFEWTD